MLSEVFIDGKKEITSVLGMALESKVNVKIINSGCMACKMSISYMF